MPLLPSAVILGIQKSSSRAGGQYPQAVQDDPIQVHAYFSPFTMGTPGCSLRSIIIFAPSSASSTVAPNTKPTGWKVAHTQRRARCGQTCGAVGDGVQRAKHQAQDQPNHLAAVLLQRGADSTDGYSHARQHAKSQRAQPRQYCQLQAHQANAVRIIRNSP